MNLSDTSALNLTQQAKEYWFEEDYEKAASLYEEAINSEPNIRFYYWYLGLMLLLQGQEAEAQTTWLLAMTDGEAEEVEIWTKELLQVLRTEAERQEGLSKNSISWAIRQHIKEIDPGDINNLLLLIRLSIKLEIYSGDEPDNLGVIQLLNAEKIANIDSNLLMQVLERVLNCEPLHLQSFELVNACLGYVRDSKKFIDLLLLVSSKLASPEVKQPELAIKYVKVGLSLEPDNWDIFRYLSIYYQIIGNHAKAVEMAQQCYLLSDKLPDRVYISHLIVRAWMNASGYLLDARLALQEHESLLLSSLFRSPPENLNEPATVRLFSTSFYFPYARDDPKANIYLRNQIAKICQKNIANYAQGYIAKYRQKQSTHRTNPRSNKPLKIGYLSHCLKQHSVGWLARWLFIHHDREKFSIYAYLTNSQKINNDPLESWYMDRVEQAYQFLSGTNSVDIADRIYEDEIDILVDLDSITLDVTPAIMALKSAPVQVTWLGWDASGGPEIDYYIADNYVLPEDAQDYYSEKIWRLPETYLAVDGFEVDVPTLTREDLNISSDAVIYFSSQRGFKYNPEMLRLQLKILKEVPNSYFLIKGMMKQELVQEVVINLAKEEGVNQERIKFLSAVPSPAMHRANLQIADVVLDTYPYNGATTTMETLWMCIPMVTRVGEQFAARNSYTMMVNAGINEGIAWTDEEYLEWGIRLGKDEKLRQEISWKLRKSKQTAPLWNGKQFAREMEKAYEGMWQRYIQGGN